MLGKTMHDVVKSVQRPR